jgi:hypothetical protein
MEYVMMNFKYFGDIVLPQIAAKERFALCFVSKTFSRK